MYDEILTDQYNKYIYPKPIENINKEILEKGKIFTCDPNFYWHKLWPEKKHINKDLKIFIAGCGADQAAILAYLNPYHKFIACDLSKKSIEHEEKLKKKYNIKNLKLICNDFRKLKFNEKFDYIISTGVIHHLEKPETALKFFYENLKNEGVIYLMVYGNKQRYALNKVKTIFNLLKFNQDKKSIIQSKNLIESLHSEHPAKIFVNSVDDINYDSGIIDLLLHKKETFYSIGNLINLLKKNKLIIKNTVDENLSSLTKYFLFDQNIVEKIRTLNPDEKILMSQVMNWNDYRINLIICKNSQLKNSILYNTQNIFENYIKFSLDKEYQFNKNNIKIIDKLSKNYISFNLSKYIDILNLKKSLIGQNKIKTLIQNNEYSNNFLNILFENSLVEMSKFPFVNSLKILENNLRDNRS